MITVLKGNVVLVRERTKEQNELLCVNLFKIYKKTKNYRSIEVLFVCFLFLLFYLFLRPFARVKSQKVES